MVQTAINQKWVLDTTHSELLFKVKHLMITNIKGEFRTFSASIISPENDFEQAEIMAKIDAGSIFTNNSERDAHLKNEDFLDVEKFPEMQFKSTAIKKIDDETFTVIGALTIKGITKEISLAVDFGGRVKDPYGNEKAGFSINGKLNRKDFGLTWNMALEAGGVMVSDEVKLSAEVQFIKQV